MKQITIITSFLLITTFVNAQATAQKQNYQVSLDTQIAINNAHPYIDLFSSKDDLYIAWLYATNKKNMKNTPKYANPAVIVDDSDGNNSLIFTLANENGIRYDTLRNSVHEVYESRSQSLLNKLRGLSKIFGKDGGWSMIGKKKYSYRNNDMLDFQDLQGSLPEGSMMYLEDKNWGLKFGVKISEFQSQVKITITNEAGSQVSTVVDKELRRGWNNFKWKRKQLPHGMYNISVTIDGHTMTQNFEC